MGLTVHQARTCTTTSILEFRMTEFSVFDIKILTNKKKDRNEGDVQMCTIEQTKYLANMPISFSVYVCLSQFQVESQGRVTGCALWPVHAEVTEDR